MITNNFTEAVIEMILKTNTVILTASSDCDCHNTQYNFQCTARSRTLQSAYYNTLFIRWLEAGIVT